MSKKIIFVDQRRLTDPRLSWVVDQYSYDWQRLHQLTIWSKFNSFYPRAGINNIPLDNNMITQLNYTMPEYNKNFQKNFDEITNERCKEILTLYKDYPIVILWSGGIDSTVAVASVLKNTTAAERKQIIIGYNGVSVYENPQFFLKHIQPNFQLIDVATITEDSLNVNDYYLIDGEPADQLYSGGISQGLLLNDPDALTRNLHLDPDRLLKYLATATDDNKFAQWFYELIMENIKSVDIPIETYHDFFWWFQFNYTWADVQLRNRPKPTDKETFHRYLTNKIHWYDTGNYQQWSMTNNQVGIKFNNNLGEYKLAAKKYIYDLDRNEYYFKFKTKKHSIYRNGVNSRPHSFCILDDYTSLMLETDLDKILELLPDHILSK
jgi:hypothetical protein